MIWVTGSRGMLGSDVTRCLKEAQIPVVGTDAECDITDLSQVRDFAGTRRLSWIVNCAAFTAVDAAEDDSGTAHRVNAQGPENLARVAAEAGCRLIHLSTDYVFAGNATVPYEEDHVLAPLGEYGRSKAEGEKRLARQTGEHFIVRTAWLYGLRGKNFVLTMLRLMNERRTVSVVADQRGSPTYTRDLARALCAMIQADSRAFGVYHFVNAGSATWYEFASEIYRLGRGHGRIMHACDVRPITTEEYPTRTVRPRYSVLSTRKFQSAFGFEAPAWQDALARFFQQLGQEAT